MKTLELKGYLANVRARKALLGPDSSIADAEVCRNDGVRRTARKRLALERAEARATAAGATPIVSNY
ncbi:hypothetical protein [Novosphingobium sp. KN65.2]|uniref:hypothetical protein n=1 Tax=Novosphingobium sp. KN65.2 TaxID=1478134 RepID=UPI0005DB8FD4|nr:hypothetical protein [Novosphingobium sp. KN65.2]CDO34169.1 conserved hypothetical protein [Novosphingobium sp. KN65.2]